MSQQNHPEDSPQHLDEETHQEQSLPTPSSQTISDEMSKFLYIYSVWRAWKVGNSEKKLLDCDQQIKNEKIIKRFLGLPTNYYCEQILDEEWVWKKSNENLMLEYLSTSPPSEFQVDDEDTAVYKTIFSNPAENQVENITAETQADLEAKADDFSIFLETSPIFETILVGAVQENATTLQPEEQIQAAAEEEEILHSLQLQVQEILTDELEIVEKSVEYQEKSTPPDTMEEKSQEEPEVEVQRSFEEAAEDAQIARLEVTETPVAIIEQQIADVVRDSISHKISNYIDEEAEEELVKTLKINEEDAEEEKEAESHPLQFYHSVPPSHQVTNFYFHSSSISTLPDEMPESWTRKVQGMVETALESQKASFKEELDKIEVRHNQILEKTEEKYSSNLKEISQTINKTLEIISFLIYSLSNTMMTYASSSHLQLKEVLAENQKEVFKLFKHFATFTAKHKLDLIVQYKNLPEIQKLHIQANQGELGYIPTHLKMTDLLLEAQQSNPELSVQHISNNEFDGTEAFRTIASHFTNEAQQKEQYDNLKRIRSECGVIQDIGESAESSRRKRS
ncbi:unnamed protein product [Cuscuta campestris]|uniref:Uncharacterized protein n=1 Tax=Cuscuta campestris TaxID=132261 RepID=A0A484MIA5_9ASTE|nr:unnamed protein product [Cuscuta campestris]